MKITKIEFKKIRLQMDSPFRVAFAEINYSENVLVRVTTEDGTVGYGEAAPLMFVTGETAESVIAVLEMLRPGLIGTDPFAVDSIHHMIDAVIHGNGSAKCAIDMALYDLQGKITGIPVYRLLGGGSGQVQNDITIGIDEPEEMARFAQHYARDLGYNILKVKAGIDLKQDIESMTLIRKVVGDGIRLRVDANQGYTVSTAICALEEFRQLGIEAVEQCLPHWDLEGAAFLRGKVGGIKLMLDESIHGPRDAARACGLSAADILNIKIMKCGGIYPALQIDAIAGASGVNCMVGCMLETRLAITAGLSLAAARKNITEADCDSFYYYNEEETGVTGGFTMDRDIFTLSQKPGFGVEVDF